MTKSKIEIPTSSFFTELDALFDTRMGTLLKIDKTRIDAVLTSDYFVRKKDVFAGYSNKEFEDAYNNRDVATLRNSMVTPMVRYMRDFCANTFMNNANTPFIKEPTVTINTHPYKLSKADLLVLEEGFRIKLNNIVRIDFVDFTCSQITPNYLKDNCSVISVYDPYEWLDTNSANGVLKKQFCPNIMMLGPLMLRNKNAEDIDMKEFESNMEFMTKPFIELMLMGIDLFSMDVLPKKTYTTTTTTA